MKSGDGLIVRLSAPAAGLTPPQLRALARAAATHGNGLLEITRRGKLQLRGIRENALAALQTELTALGLAESNALTVNPLAGLHPGCAPLEALATELERALAAGGARAELSEKFGVVLDSGGVLRAVAADIRVEVDAAQPERAQLSAAGELLATGPTSRAAEAVVALARQLAASGEGRMRDLVSLHGTASLRTCFDGSAPLASSAAELPSMIGFHDGWLGLALAFGSGEEAPWLAIAEIAERFGSGEIRVTPFRAVILPGVTAAPARAITAHVLEAGLILDPADPLLRAIACPGAPACASAYGPTRPLARQLARELLPLMDADARLHVSGCSKRCAHDGTATVTLVHDPAGSQLVYDHASGA